VVNDMLRIVRRGVMRVAAREPEHEHRDQDKWEGIPAQPALVGRRLLAVPVAIFNAHSRLSAGTTVR